MALRYDLHIHSCLSPCAANDMTPNNIAGMAHLAGVQVLSVCDHNTAQNLPAVKKACAKYNIRLLPAIEANTAEEIHILCYFPTVEGALSMSDLLYENLPDIPCKEEYFGEQIIMNSEDKETGRLTKLLLNATKLTLQETVKEIQNRGGICIPAHIDRDSYSVISALGTMPQSPIFAAVELADIQNKQLYIQQNHITTATEILVSSDAHYLENIAMEEWMIDETSTLWNLVNNL